MSHVYLISDLHLGHRNLAIHRGFRDEQDQDEYIVSQWNKTISKRDTVWILGDISMEKSSPYPLLATMNGIKKIVLGNHDQPQHVPELYKYANYICGMFKYQGYIFTHCPIHESEIKNFGINIHGHVHENTLNDSRYINVSCDVLDYKPIRFDAIKTLSTKAI